MVVIYDDGLIGVLDLATEKFQEFKTKSEDLINKFKIYNWKDRLMVTHNDEFIAIRDGDCKTVEIIEKKTQHKIELLHKSNDYVHQMTLTDDNLLFIRFGNHMIYKFEIKDKKFVKTKEFKSEFEIYDDFNLKTYKYSGMILLTQF